MISGINFCENLRNSQILSSDLENKKNNEKPFFENKNNILMMGLGILALSGMAFIAINNLKRSGKNKEVPKQIAKQFSTYIEQFNNFFSMHTPDCQNVISQQSSLKNKKVLDFLESAKEFDIFRKVFVLNKDSKIVPYPRFIGFCNTDSKTTSLFAKSIADEYKWDFTKRKYNSSYMKEFMKMLKNESEIEKKPRFIYIENFKQMKLDIDKGSQENRDIMQTILKNNKKNDIIYITNDTDTLKINDLTFRFKDNIDNQYVSIKNQITTGYDECIQKIHVSTLNTNNFILNNGNGNFFKSFLQKDFQNPVILAKDSNEQYLRQFIDEVNKYEKARLKIFECDNDRDLYKKLIQELEQHNNHFNLYDEKTYLHITNIEPYLDDSVVNTLKNANKNFNTIPIIEYNDESLLLKIFEDNYNFKFGRNFVYTEELSAQIAKRAKNNDLSHITQNDFQYLITSFVLPKFENGIILQGKSDIADITIKSLINTFDMNYAKIKFDKETALDNLKTLFKTANKAKKDFELTGKRTFIELENIDELLTNFSTVGNRRNIAKFKNFAEYCSKDYETTLVFHTTKNLDDFEPASIAPHRFSLKIKLI